MFLILFPFTGAVCFALEWLCPNHPAPKVTEMVIKAILFSLVMSAINSSRRWRLSITKSLANYQIVVEEDEITTRNFSSCNRMLSRTIRRVEVRTVIEKEQGMLISSRNSVATSFWVVSGFQTARLPTDNDDCQFPEDALWSPNRDVCVFPISAHCLLSSPGLARPLGNSSISTRMRIASAWEH